MALEIARQKEREAVEPPPPQRELVFEFWPDTLATTHPCHAATRDWSITATCTCGRRRWLDLKVILPTYLAHAPWPRVMQSMTCEDCGGQPVLLSFDSAPMGLENRRVSFGHVRVRLAPTKT